MKQERIKILSMLEEGKLTVDEATKLLEAIGTTANSSYSDTTAEFQEKISRVSASLDAIGRELGDKFVSAYKSMEPKVKGATKNVMIKTASVLDDLSKSVNEAINNMEVPEEECCCSEKEGAECCCNPEDAADNCCCQEPPKENNQ